MQSKNVIEIKTKNIFEDMKEDLHLFDTSDYQKSHPCYTDKRKKVIGKFKDELKGVPISLNWGALQGSIVKGIFAWLWQDNNLIIGIFSLFYFIFLLYI